MANRRREQELAAIVEKYWSDWERVPRPRNNHVFFRLRCGPFSRLISTSATPHGGARSTRNFEADVKRLAKELQTLRGQRA